jgi:hypothetical protein
VTWQDADRGELWGDGLIGCGIGVAVNQELQDGAGFVDPGSDPRLDRLCCVHAAVGSFRPADGALGGFDVGEGQ